MISGKEKEKSPVEIKCTSGDAVKPGSGIAAVRFKCDFADIKTKFDSIENDVIEPSLTVTYDWYSCPNVFRAVYGTDVAIYKDEDTKSLFSIPGRGREVWAEETSCALNDGETLKAYAKRRLEELQKVSTIISYDRRYDPDIYPTDVITLGYPEQEISGNFMVSSQTINLGFNGRTSEEVIKI